MNLELVRKNVTTNCGNSAVKWELLDDQKVVIEGETFLLTPWRFNRRLQAMRNLAIDQNVLRRNCSYKSVRVGNCRENLAEELLRELDICEWMLNDQIISVYAMANGNKTLSMILKTKQDALCSIEMATTLPEDTSPIIRHEIVGLEGMISDRSINEQVPVEAVYLFGQDKKGPVTFTDMDSVMYGLTPYEIMLVDNVVALIKDRNNQTFHWANADRIRYLSDCVWQSVNTGEVVSVEG